METADINEFGRDIKSIFDLINSSQLQENILILKIVFIVISIVFLGLIIYFSLKTTYLELLFIEDMQNSLSWKDYGQSKVLKKWKRIKKRLKKDNHLEHKLALIEAAKLLEDILKKMGENEISLADKLRELEIHNIYQEIAEDTDYKLSRAEAEKVIGILEKSLKELEVF
jgi:hypothetical protein